MKFLIGTPKEWSDRKFLIWTQDLVESFNLPEGHYGRRLVRGKDEIFNEDSSAGGKLGRQQKQWRLSGITRLLQETRALGSEQFNGILLGWIEQPNTFCFALPHWDQDPELGRLHFIAWDFIAQRAVQSEPTSDRELFEKLQRSEPQILLFEKAMCIFWHNIDDRCKALQIPSLKAWHEKASNSRPAWPKTVLNPFHDEKQAIETYCKEQGFTDEQRQEIEKLENTYPGFISFVFSRGAAQTHFRTSLLFAYDRKCAFCDFAIEEALEAAHIVPWVECNVEDQKDSANGFLLCATHHRLFDRGRLKVTNDLAIEIDSNQAFGMGTDQREEFGLIGNQVRNARDEFSEKRKSFIARRNRR